MAAVGWLLSIIFFFGMIVFYLGMKHYKAKFESEQFEHGELKTKIYYESEDIRKELPTNEDGVYKG